MKKIIIEETVTGTKFIVENLSHFEALGLLRFYEKKLWLEMSLEELELKKKQQQENEKDI